MKYLIIIFLKILICSAVFGQYQTVIRSLVKLPANLPMKLKGSFRQRESNDLRYYRFSNGTLDLRYYPVQMNVPCGYFLINGEKVQIDKENDDSLSCDLDYGSFEVYKYHLNGKKYLILNAIRYGSGSTTRYVYCNLFDITKRDTINYHQLASIYGSRLSFGDYNNDGRIDFLEIGYNKNSKSVDDFTLTIKTFDESTYEFARIQNKFINFTRHYSADNNLVIIKTSDNW